MQNSKVVAIIQARMSSSRLPGKIMADIEGHPMLFHIIERARRIMGIDDLVIATTTQRSDDLVEQWAKTNGVNVFRGSEEDVLKRYFDTALKYNADVVVRICADSPLFDPELTGKMIVALVENRGDYIALEKNQPSANSGVNVLSFTALKEAHEKASAGYQREHVVPYFIECPRKFKYVYVSQNPAFARSDFRLSVDTASDLELIREIYKHLHKKSAIIDLKKVIKFLDKNPAVKKINAHVVSIGGQRPGFKILIIVAASQKVGYGHLFRMLTLAKTLTERFANSVEFLIEGDHFAKNFILKKHFLLITTSHKTLQDYISPKFTAVIIDSHENKLNKIFSGISTRILRVSYDDEQNGEFADINFMPFGSKYKKVHKGFKYLILGNKFDKLDKKKRQYLLISAGAADSNNCTLKIAQILLNRKAHLPLALLIGPFHKHKKKLENFKKNFPHVKVFEKANLNVVFSQTRMAICYFGVTMFEMISWGIICAVFSINPRQSKEIKFFKKSILSDLGPINSKNFKTNVDEFLNNKNAQLKIRENVMRISITNGDYRVAKIIQGTLLKGFKG